MNVSLTPELEKYIGGKVKTGKYQTASEVVREALRFMQERDARVAELTDKIQAGIDSLDAGEGRELERGAIRRAVQNRTAKRSKRVG